jgi:hypothetical protein
VPADEEHEELATAAAASADAPTIVQQALRRSIPNFVQCSGFTVTGEFDVNADRHDLRRSERHADSGKSIPDEGNQIVTADLVTGTSTTDGRVRVDAVLPADGG